MDEVPSKHSMLTAYNALAVRCWEDPAARARFVDAPREALAVYGWEVPETTSVTIEVVDADGDVRQLSADEIVNVWRRGMETGELRIKIAADPPEVGPGELSQEELDSVTGGTYTAPSNYPP